MLKEQYLFIYAKKIKILIVRCHDEHDEIKVIIIISIQKIDFALISIFDNLIVAHCQWWNISIVEHFQLSNILIGNHFKLSDISIVEHLPLSNIYHCQTFTIVEHLNLFLINILWEDYHYSLFLAA